MMAQNVLPTGKAVRIIGDVAWQDPSFTGFVIAEIKCHKDILVPLLVVKVNGKTIAGTVTWPGIYFAAELREAPTSLTVYSGGNPIVLVVKGKIGEIPLRPSTLKIPPLNLNLTVYEGGNPITLFSRESILVDKQDIPGVIWLYPPGTHFDRRGKPIIIGKYLDMPYIYKMKGIRVSRFDQNKF